MHSEKKGFLTGDKKGSGERREHMKSKRTTQILFIVYLIVLSWVILFKMEFNMSALSKMNLRSVNLVPFAGSMLVNGKADVSEIILNMVVFMPFGVYVSMLNGRQNILVKVLPIAGVSLLYESLQYALKIGASDITDFLGNTLGGMLGILFFALVYRVLENKSYKVLNTIALMGTVFALCFLGLISFPVHV